MSFACARSGEVAHRVLHALLQGDAEDVACARAGAERLEQAARGHDGALVPGTLGARIATRRGLAARLTLLTLVPRHGLAGIAASFRLLRAIGRSERIRPLRGGAHDQRPRADDLRLGAHARRRNALAQHLHRDHQHQRRDGGAEQALPVGRFGGDLRRGRNPADPQRQLPRAEEGDAFRRQGQEQSLSIGLAAAAHEQLGTQGGLAVLRQRERQGPRCTDHPAGRVAADDHRT